MLKRGEVFGMIIRLLEHRVILAPGYAASCTSCEKKDIVKQRRQYDWHLCMYFFFSCACEGDSSESQKCFLSYSFPKSGVRNAKLQYGLETVWWLGCDLLLRFGGDGE